MTDPATFTKGFEKLSDNNWASWKLNVQLALINAKVWKFVNPVPLCTVNTDDASQGKATSSTQTAVVLPEGDDEQSSLALSIIRFSMNTDQLQYVGNEMSPRKAWKMLVAAKEAKTGMALVTKLTELMNIKQGEETPVAEHCARISQLKRELDELIDTDHKRFSKALYAALLVRSLNDRYEAFTVNVLQTEADQLEFDDIVRRAKLEEQRQKDRTASLANSEPLVASANYARASANKGKDKYCSYHKSTTHSDSECYTQHPELRTSERNQQKRQSAHSAELHYATMASPLTTASTLPNQWLIDSAATIHMCNDRTMFNNLKHIPVNIIVFGAGNTTISTEAGDISARVQLDDKEFVVTLTNVLYAPAIKRNLISMMHWAKQGVTCKTEGDGSCLVARHGTTIGRVMARNNLLPVKVIPIHRSNLQSADTASHDSLDVATLWHRRLGHVNQTDMKRLVSMANGFDCDIPFNDDDCESCAKGKLHALPHPKAAQHRAKVPLELIHTDLCGPLPRTRDGFRYFICFIDDCTRFTEVRLLQNKHEAMTAFLDYKAWIERATQRNIKMLRSDGGGEYVSKQFTQWLSEEGIQRQVSAPYSQQQNGVSERFNRTVVECSRAMLDQAGLDETYWGDAVLTATHLRNRLPTVALDDHKTPFEAFYGHKPSLSHLRVFGCRAYALVHKSQRGKMDAKARVCINLGYIQGYKAYRLLDTKTNRTIVSRNVRFVENRFWNDNDGQVGESNRQANVSNDFDFDMPSRSVTNRSFNESDAESEVAKLNEQPIVNNDNGHKTSGSNKDTSRTIETSSSNTEENHDKQTLPTIPTSTGSGMWRAPYVTDTNAGARLDELVTDILNHHPNLAQKRLNEADQLQLQHIADTHKYSIKQLTERMKALRQERAQQQANVSTVPIHEAYAAEIAETLTSDPKSHQEAMNRPDADKWKKAEQEEMDSIVRANTWTLMELPVGRQAIGCKWVYKTKYDKDGNVEREKARLVAKGYTQQHGIDYDETFSPVLRYASLRALLAITAHYDLELHQMDVKTAFLNGDIDHEIYMRQPEGHEVKGKEHLVCKLNKSLYGLKQAGRAWYERIHTEFQRMALIRLESEHCMYVKRTTNCIIIIGLYVDDLILISNSLKELNAIKCQLAELFEMKDLGEARFILGIKIDRDRANRRLTIAQTEYVKNIVAKYGMEESRMTTYTPLNTGVKLVKSGLANEPESETVNIKEYQAAVGSIMYAMLGTRPDIAHAISKLAQYSSDPRKQHWNAVKQLVRYLATTADYGLTYNGEHEGDMEPHLVGFTDSDWGNDQDTRRSTTGYVFRMAGGVISWKSKRQPTVALSTTEAEYMAACDATREAISWRTFLAGLGFDMSKPTLIYSDNQGSIALSKNPEHHARSKHIDVRHHYVREQVALGSVAFQYITTSEMVADALTKALPRDRHNALIKEMGLGSSLSTSMRRLSGSVGNRNRASTTDETIVEVKLPAEPVSPSVQ